MDLQEKIVFKLLKEGFNQGFIFIYNSEEYVKE